jgi:hypothetical protein
MPKSRAIRVQAGWFVALQLVAWAGLALFVVLYRGPLPDELLAASFALWAGLGQVL